MRRRLLFVGLLAVFPVFASAQEAKLVNCRTLEAAGNFVGPDEVIVDDLVCQKAKAGANATAKPQAQKPLVGTVISDTPPESVVDAAKAAEKRVASRREAEAEKNAASAAAEPAPVNAPPRETSVPPTAPAKATEAVAEPPANAAPAVATHAPTPEPAPAPSLPAVQPSSQPVAAAPPPAIAPQPAPAAEAEVTVPAGAAPQVAASPASEPAAKSESPALPEIVLSSAPASAPPVEPKTEPPAEIAPAPAAGVAPADPARPATSGGFYDANAPKTNANSAPQANTGFASAEQVNAGLTPGAKTTDPPPSAPTAQEREPEPEATTTAAARIPFDDPNSDRSVKLGDFSQPHAVAPDPSMEHRTSVDASADDGFQDRQRPECTKNITLGGLRGEKLVLGVPSWAAKWIEKNEKRMPQICFSETPMKGARNYLIVFYTPGEGASSKEILDAAVSPVKGTGAAGVGTFTTNFGSTWHYSVDRNVGTTILTQDDGDEPHGKPGQVLYATAYTEEGVPVTQRWPGQPKKEIKATGKNPKKVKGEVNVLEHVSGDLLSQMVEDIEKF